MSYEMTSDILIIFVYFERRLFQGRNWKENHVSVDVLYKI